MSNCVEHIFLFACMLMLAPANAQFISRQRAIDVASVFMHEDSNTDILLASGNRNANIVEFVDDSQTCFYGVGIDNSWVFVSADERVQPILGVIRQSQEIPSLDNMPPAMKDLFGWYTEEIRYIQDSVKTVARHPQWEYYINSKSARVINESRNTGVPNLLEIEEGDVIRWGQDFNSDPITILGKEFNRLCPTFHNVFYGHNVTGCVATAIGQIMKYWQWPYSAIVPTEMCDTLGHTSGATLHEYDWTKMPSQLHNSTPDEEVLEVAGLLRDVGYAVNMEYRCDGSYVFLSAIYDTLKTKFRYASSIAYHKKGLNWVNRLKSEIDAGRPIIYDAWRKDSTNNKHGHAFILSGYDTANRFYVNWGVRKPFTMFDGFFLLDSLHTYNTPDYYYRYDHAAIFGIQPDYPSCGDYVMLDNDISPDLFEIYRGGKILGLSKTIPANKSGVIYSGESIILRPPFKIKRGAKVHMAIKDMHCGQAQMNSPRRLYVPLSNNVNIGRDNSQSLLKEVFSVSPNPVSSILHINTSDELSQAKIYTINGQCVLQASQTDIDVSSLPQGMYILRAMTADGQEHQAKFIKQ